MDIVSETTIKESCAWVLDSDRGAAPVPSQFPRRLHTEIPWLSWIRNIKHESEMGGQCRKECWAPMDLVWRMRCFPLFRTAITPMVLNNNACADGREPSSYHEIKSCRKECWAPLHAIVAWRVVLPPVSNGHKTMVPSTKWVQDRTSDTLCPRSYVREVVFKVV